MGANTYIEWCHHTANLWWGCAEVHRGCDNCYAKVFARAKGKALAWDGVRFTTVAVWKNLIKWDREAAAAGEVRRVFTGSMMDIFEKSMPASDWQGKPIPGVTTGDLRDRYFREVVPVTPNLLHLLLTKRPGNIPKMVPAEWLDDWPANVMTGTSIVDQATADTLLSQLLHVPGGHFLSVEPLLAPVKLPMVVDTGEDMPEDERAAWGLPAAYIQSYGSYPTAKVDWCIVGCESGPKARPMDEAWVRSLRDQCVSAGVPFFYKQKLVGREVISLPELDGRRWDQVPDAMAPAGSEAAR